MGGIGATRLENMLYRGPCMAMFKTYVGGCMVLLQRWQALKELGGANAFGSPCTGDPNFLGSRCLGDPMVLETPMCWGGDPNIMGIQMCWGPHVLGTTVYWKPQYIGDPNAPMCFVENIGDPRALGTQVYWEPQCIRIPNVFGTPTHSGNLMYWEPKYIGDPKTLGIQCAGIHTSLPQHIVVPNVLGFPR